MKPILKSLKLYSIGFFLYYYKVIVYVILLQSNSICYTISINKVKIFFLEGV
jgi:hypothetical protein